MAAMENGPLDGQHTLVQRWANESVGLAVDLRWSSDFPENGKASISAAGPNQQSMLLCAPLKVLFTKAEVLSALLDGILD